MIENKRETNKNEIKDKSLSNVLYIISDELKKIGSNLNEIPFPSGENITKEQISAFQDIDFDSQKLRDFSSILAALSKNSDPINDSYTIDFNKLTRLEYVQRLME